MLQPGDPEFTRGFRANAHRWLTLLSRYEQNWRSDIMEIVNCHGWGWPEKEVMRKRHLGVATLERRSRWGRGGAGPVRCGIPSRHRSLLRDRWRGVERWPRPSARSTACRSAPYDL